MGGEVKTLYQGEFRIDAKVTHTSAITGALKLTGEAAVATALVAEADLPVFGKKLFPSKEFWIEPASADRMAFAFKLQNSPHKFFMVFFGASSDGGLTYAGSILRADATLEDIQKALAGAGTPPASWIAKGSATLKKAN